MPGSAAANEGDDDDDDDDDNGALASTKKSDRKARFDKTECKFDERHRTQMMR